jgi:hypothetical protein
MKERDKKRRLEREQEGVRSAECGAGLATSEGRTAGKHDKNQMKELKEGKMSISKGI